VLRKLATEEQLQELQAYCAELFQMTPVGPSAEEIGHLRVANQSKDAVDAAWGSEDLGILPAREIGDVEGLKAQLELCSTRPGRQLGFLATERDRTQRYTSWDPEFQEGSQWREGGHIVPLVLQEQQLDGIYSILHMLFTPTPGPKSGVLIADAMGVGKTA
jgi:hypothetical protein